MSDKNTDLYYPLVYRCGNCRVFQLVLDGTEEDYEQARAKMAVHRKECRKE